MQYSNSGTAYVNYRGADRILESVTEHRIEDHRDGAGCSVAISTLKRGDRFRFQHDGVVNTLLLIGNARYDWHNYQGEHYLWAGTYAGSGKVAWPYVYPTTDPETVVTLP